MASKDAFGTGDPFGGGFTANNTSKSAQYAANARRLAAKNKPGHRSGILGAITGTIAHLGNDVVQSAEGLPMGVYKLATQNPITSAKELYAGEKQTWAPLLRGDYHQFVHQFYEHPLGPILDVAGLLTGGAGLAGKAGLLGDLAVGGERTLKVGDVTENIGRYSDNPVIRLRQKAFDEITKKMPQQTPLMGETARAHWALKRIEQSGLAKNKRVADNYILQSHKLPKTWQHTAYMTVSSGLSPLETLHQRLHFVEQKNAGLDKQLATGAEDLKKLQQKLADHAGEVANHADTLENMTTSKALQSQWDAKTRRLERAGNKLDAQHELLKRKIEDLQAQRAANHINEHEYTFLSDPRAEQLFHDVQAAHKELTKLGYENDLAVTAPAAVEAAQKAGGKLVNPQLRDIIGQVKMSKDVANVLKARDAAKASAELDAKLSKLDPAIAARRPYMRALLHEGATWLPDKLHLWESKTGALRLGEKNAETGKVYPVGAGGTHKAFGAHIPKDKVTKLAPEEAQAYLDQLFPLDNPNVSRDLWHKDGLDKLLTKVKDRHAATGRAEPVYFPDKMLISPSEKGRTRLDKATNGSAVRQIKNHQNEGALYMAGLISHDPLVLAHKTMANIMVAHAADVADLLRAHAVSHAGPDIPKGYVALTDQAIKRNYMNDTLPAFRQKMEEAISANSPTNAVRHFIDAHFTSDPAVAGTHKLIVPKKWVDSLVPEVRASASFAGRFYNQTQGLWKHIVLAGRPLPFIVNNVVGNTVMYGLQHSGPEGVRALARSANEERMFEELAPEHHLTFGQAHAVKRPGRIGKIVNLAYHAVGAHEHLLRRAAFTAAAKGMPEVKKAIEDLKTAGYKANENDNRTLLHSAVLKADKANHGLITKLGSHIDDVMGNYRTYSKSEEQIRKIMPFYSWNRHAARAYFKVLTDKPLTGALMTHVGMQGSAEQKKILGDVPEFMKQYIPANILSHLGYGPKGNKSVLNASVFNPESTVGDEVNLIRALISGKPGEGASDLTSNLSPLITAPIQAATGKSLLTGAPVASNFGTGHGALGQALADTLVNLPIPKLIETALPAGTRGSAAKDMSLDRNRFTPTGKPKAKSVSTLSKDETTQLLGTLAGLPAKSVNVKAAQAWQKNLEGKAKSTQFHVAKKRAGRRKKSTSPFGATALG